MKNNPKSKKSRVFYSGSNGMSISVKTVTRLSVGILFVYGVYVVLRGHLYPGGGLAGGGIMALALLNLIIAFGKDVALSRVKRDSASVLAAFGLLLFLIIGLMGFTSGGFFSNFMISYGWLPDFFEGGTLMFSNIAIGILMGAGFYTIFTHLIMLRVKEVEK